MQNLQQLFEHARTSDQVVLGFICTSPADIQNVITFSHQRSGMAVSIYVPEPLVSAALTMVDVPTQVHTDVPASLHRARELYTQGIRSFGVKIASSKDAARELVHKSAWVEGGFSQVNEHVANIIQVYPQGVLGAFTGSAYIDTSSLEADIAGRSEYVAVYTPTGISAEGLQELAALPISTIVLAASELHTVVDELALKVRYTNIHNT